jgi:hypothetical protein
MGLQVTLDNDSIIAAIKDYVEHSGIDTTNKEVEISLRAGRGTNGYSAIISIADKKRTGEPEVTPKMGQSIFGAPIVDNVENPEDE